MTGGPRPVILSQLTAAGARAIFEDFVDGQPRRLQEFTAEAWRRAGPDGELDRSLSSLDRLMEWMVEAHPRGPGDEPFQPPDDMLDESAGPRREAIVGRLWQSRRDRPHADPLSNVP